MLLFTVLISYCLLSAFQVIGYNINLQINDSGQHKNHLQRQTLKDNQQNVFLQHAQSIEVSPNQREQHGNHFLASSNAQPNNFQQNFQLPRIDQSHPQPQHQHANTNIHTQNFLALRNYANKQYSPQQTFSSTQFQTNSPHLAQQQPNANSNFLSNAFQQQYPSGFEHTLVPKLKEPTEIPVLPFPQRLAPQKTFSQANWQQPVGLQQLPSQQQHQNFQLTPNLGTTVPQIYVHHQSNSLQQKPHPSQELRNDFQKQQIASQYQQIPHFQVDQPQDSDQDYKQKLIKKHEQFVQKQYEKSQIKVRQQHEDFLAKQQAIKQQVLPKISGSNIYGQTNYSPQHGRPVSPAEYPIFTSALEKYHEEHPTTTTSTTTTATITDNIKDRSNEGSSLRKTVKTISRDELLKQLKTALAEAPRSELGNKTYDEMDVVLPSGQRVQVIRTKDPNIIQSLQLNSQFQQPLGSETVKLDQTDLTLRNQDLILPHNDKLQVLRSPGPKIAENPILNLSGNVNLSQDQPLYANDPSVISFGANNIASSAVIQSDSDEPPSLEELAMRGLIPEGYEIEGISSKPKSQPTSPPPKKKATYVYLEEQEDGSFKIQGVKANGEKETKNTGAEVESILERIRSGDIKLPPSVHRLKLPNDEEVEVRGNSVFKTESTKAPETTEKTSTVTPKNNKIYESLTTTMPFQRKNSSSITHFTPTLMPKQSNSNYYHDSQPLRSYTNHALPHNEQTTESSPPYESLTTSPITERLITAEQQHYNRSILQESGVIEKSQEVQTTKSTDANHSEQLIQILKSNGFFAMAKYLHQSGLDSILNETGPYTIFVPTDKAFKNLLVQLGGPERAEEKFKANPRLLSGLLLHHVIPGAFEIANLQDEMTGVSLAGTQLRVNQYTMHDQEWNDVTLTTINGAMVVLNKKDIKIPQGIAHAVDRVMFPLPVGDLLQTLQSDRENRFSNFLKILYTSGLSVKLQDKGIKTYSVFAPVDKSFVDVESDTLEKLYNDKEAAEEFAMKHIVTGTLFSAGMRFYQVKDSLLTGKTVILQKTTAGKIKVNNAQMVTSNIPATNGVIHAIDGLLA